MRNGGRRAKGQGYQTETEKQEGLKMNARGLLYQIARVLGDLTAIKNGKVSKRAGRRVAGKITGRALRKLFK